MNKEVKEILGKLLINIDKSTNDIFEVIQKNPSSIENDRSLVHLLDLLASTLEIYTEQ